MRARAQSASWCPRLGILAKSRASSSILRCCGDGPDGSAGVHALEEVAHLDAQRPGDGVQ
jgi:hypothetical protein